MSCPPGIAFLQGSEGEESRNSESRSSRAEVESEKANSKTSLSSELTGRKENGGKSQPVDLTQVAILLCQLYTLYKLNKGRLMGAQPPVLPSKGVLTLSLCATILDLVIKLVLACMLSPTIKFMEGTASLLKHFQKVDNALASMTSWQRKKGKLC